MAVISTLVTSLPSLSHLAIYTFLALGVYVILNILNQVVKKKKKKIDIQCQLTN